MEKGTIKPGQRNHRISVIKLTKVKGTTGAESDVRNVIATVWAEKKTASTDKVIDEKVVAMNVVLWTTRWHPDIAAENIQSLFIEEGTDEYEIYGYEEIGRRKWLTFKCQYRE